LGSCCVPELFASGKFLFSLFFYTKNKIFAFACHNNKALLISIFTTCIKFKLNKVLKIGEEFLSVPEFFASSVYIGICIAYVFLKDAGLAGLCGSS